jgi:glutathionyl-hydroquinone reductase
MDKQQQTDYYTGRIKEMLRKVPDKVNNGSYETSVAFKKQAVEAQKVIASSRTKLEKLIYVHNQLSSYYN